MTTAASWARRRRVLLTAVLLAIVAIPVTAQVRIVQTNSAGNNIHLIDPTTNNIVGEITGIPINHGAAASPDGRHLYMVFPDGVGTSKAPALAGKKLGAGTARNWNTVLKLAALTA